MIWLVVLLVFIFLFVAAIQYLVWYQRWERRNTAGMAYYGKPLAERRALKQRIRRYARLARPVVSLLTKCNQKPPTMPAFEYEGVCGPPGVSSPEVFARAKNYRPQPEDVFVATQMRCGTTWMQQVVYEIVHRGRGDLTDTGHGHLYAACPWIDAVNSVSLEDAPLVGEKPTRIIKTHLPTKLCPYSDQAKYIYVTRHPVSCFASIMDYNRTLLGPLMPAVETMVEWYCSDRMYWLPWAHHVAGWWQWSRTRENVLFIHYEEMTKDFGAVLDRVAGFLGYRLMAGEKQRVSEKCSFQYMKDNEELFEMAPPNMFSVLGGKFLASGKENRHDDVTPAVRRRILDYCRESLRGTDYPACRFYAELAVPAAIEIEPAQRSMLGAGTS
ncbi:MAG: sulfotransferase domain-containing protein [Candidatus Binatia bacterium]